MLKMLAAALAACFPVACLAADDARGKWPSMAGVCTSYEAGLRGIGGYDAHLVASLYAHEGDGKNAFVQVWHVPGVDETYGVIAVRQYDVAPEQEFCLLFSGPLTVAERKITTWELLDRLKPRP